MPICQWVHNQSNMVSNTELLHQFPKLLCELIASINMDKLWISVLTKDVGVELPRQSGERSIFEH